MQIQKMQELEARYDSAKSFYRKAYVLHEDNKTKLRSYDTIVAEIEDGEATVFGTYSVTTLRHIKEFLKQNGFTADTKSQIIDDYTPQARRKERERITNLINEYVDGFSWDKLGDSSSDCFYCKGLGSSTDHLVKHLEQKYYMETLLFNAYKHRGYGSPMFVYHRDRKMKGLETPKTVLRKYFKDMLIETKGGF